MKRSIALTFIAVAVLAGCSSEPKQPTVVEKPVYIAVPPAAAAGSTTAPAYSQGSISCQDRNQYRCDNGVWSRTTNAC
jgi:uncharacterized lipoprotein